MEWLATQMTKIKSEERVRWLAEGLGFLCQEDKETLKSHLGKGVRVLNGPDAFASELGVIDQVSHLHSTGGA